MQIFLHAYFLLFYYSFTLPCKTFLEKPQIVAELYTNQVEYRILPLHRDNVFANPPKMNYNDIL